MSVGHDAAIIAGPASLIFAADPPRPPRCLCVLGTARGGTSMVAQMLIKLGVFMGDETDPSSGEDVAFLAHGGDRLVFSDPARAARRQAYLAHASRLVLAREDRHRQWGFKDPLAGMYVDELVSMIDLPGFVAVLRDPAAVAQREVLEAANPRADMLALAARAAAEQAAILEKLAGWRRPVLLVSYERALRAPRELAVALADFAGRPASPGFLDWAASYVVPDRGSGEDRALPDAGFRAATLGRAPELMLLLRESVQTAAGEAAQSDDTAMMVLVTEALDRGEAAQARELGLALLRRHAVDHVALRDGVLGAMAGPLLGRPEAALLPEGACCALFLVGLALMQLQQAPLALGYLRAAENAMRARLLLTDPQTSWLCAGSYWNTLYHLGWVGLWMERADIVAEVRAAFARAPVDPVAARLGAFGRDEFAARAAEHLR